MSAGGSSTTTITSSDHKTTPMLPGTKFTRIENLLQLYIKINSVPYTTAGIVLHTSSFSLYNRMTKTIFYAIYMLYDPNHNRSSATYFLQVLCLELNRC